MSRRAVLALTGGTVLALLLGRTANAQALVFERTLITLVTHSGRHDFTLQVADSQIKIKLGLRYQNNVPPDGGMLFSNGLGYPGTLTVTMQGLMLTTDVVFVSEDGRVAELYPWVRPNGPDVVSKLPVVAALQLAGGTISRLGITFGDRVLSPMFHQGI